MDHIAHVIIQTLQRGVDSGTWNIRDLDDPPPGWAVNLNPDRAHFPKGYQGIEYRNLLRPHGFVPPDPGEELDGVTTYTSDHPLPSSSEELPF